MATCLSVTVTLTLEAAAALTLGLLASAAVASPAQAISTYWTYLGIFIVVLFAGAWTVLARRVRLSPR